MRKICNTLMWILDKDLHRPSLFNIPDGTRMSLEVLRQIRYARTTDSAPWEIALVPFTVLVATSEGDNKRQQARCRAQIVHTGLVKG